MGPYQVRKRGTWLPENDTIGTQGYGCWSGHATTACLPQRGAMVRHRDRMAQWILSPMSRTGGIYTAPVRSYSSSFDEKSPSQKAKCISPTLTTHP
jgi:hypothetical protein